MAAYIKTLPKTATIELKSSDGLTTYWFDTETKIVYEQGETGNNNSLLGPVFTETTYTQVNDTLKNNVIAANWSKVGQYIVSNPSAYQNLNVTLDSSTSLRYPKDMLLDSSSDYMLFQFFDYTPPFGSTAQGGSAELSINLNLNAYNSSVTTNAVPSEGYKQILLYMPDDLQDAYRSNWEGKKFGSITAGVLASAGRAGTVEKLKQFATTAKDTGQRATVNAAAAAVSALAKSITGDNIGAEDVFASVGGVIRNPNVELLFQSMSLRTFDLTFRMSPYYQEETKIIEDIIKEFKRAMLPSYGAPNGVFDIQNSAVGSSFIAVPKLCQVQYMRGSDVHPHLPEYKLCAITDMNVNFTPDNNYSTFSGGGPVSYELKLNFMETKLVFADDFSTT